MIPINIYINIFIDIELIENIDYFNIFVIDFFCKNIDLVIDLVIDFSFDSNTVGFPIFPCFACAGLSELVVRPLHGVARVQGSKTLERQKSLEKREIS